MKAIFESFFFFTSFLKHAFLSSDLVPRMLTIVFCTAFGALKFQNFLEQNAPGQTLPPPPRRGLTPWPCCWNSQLLYSNLLKWGSRPWYGMVWIFQELPNMSLPLKNVQNVQSRGFSPKESNSNRITRHEEFHFLHRDGGAGGGGLALAHFCFVLVSTCPGSADFSYHVEIKLLHSLSQSVSIYAFMIIHSFMHSFIHSFIHASFCPDLWTMYFSNLPPSSWHEFWPASLVPPLLLHNHILLVFDQNPFATEWTE